MASQGPNSPGTLANVAGTGSIAWTNPTNAGASDDSRATAGPGMTGFSRSNWLIATNFGFSIPTGATIDGIVVEHEVSYSGTNAARDYRVYLQKAGSNVGNNGADFSNAWTTTDTYKVRNGPINTLWNTTWTPDEINDSSFGVALDAVGTGKFGSGTARVDHIRITVTYTEAAAGGKSSTVVLQSVNRASRF